jgi:FkbM family methyltransferase
MILTHVLDFIGYRCIEISHRLKGHQVHPAESTERYSREDPYELKRVTYPLMEESLVVDLGGYRGEWAQRIFCRYRCMIDIYEPNLFNVAYIRTMFWGMDKVQAFPFALSDKRCVLDLRGDDIYASLHGGDGDIHEVFVEKASEVFSLRYSGKTIDLLKINIEGSEYEVLPDLIENYNMQSIRNIQIQFHNTVKDYAGKRAAIQQALSKTHKMDWCYDYLYESWSAIDSGESKL